MVYTRVRAILVAGLHHVPLLLYVVLLGLIYRSHVVTVYQRTTCEYCQIDNVWGSITLLILKVYHRVQTNTYAAVLTYCQLFVYAT